MVIVSPLNGVKHPLQMAFSLVINGSYTNYLRPSWEPILQVGHHLEIHFSLVRRRQGVAILNVDTLETTNDGTNDGGFCC